MRGEDIPEPPSATPLIQRNSWMIAQIQGYEDTTTTRIRGYEDAPELAQAMISLILTKRDKMRVKKERKIKKVRVKRGASAGDAREAPGGPTEHHSTAGGWCGDRTGRGQRLPHVQSVGSGGGRLCRHRTDSISAERRPAGPAAHRICTQKRNANW